MATSQGLTEGCHLNQTAVAMPRARSKNTRTHILLATAMVNLITKNGSKISARALLDSGSQTGFITTRLYERLGSICSYENTFHIGGIANSITQVNTMVDLTLESQANYNYRINTSFAVLDKITCRLPQVQVDTTKINIPSYFILADPNYYKTSEIDLLIAADIYFEMILPGMIKLGSNLPILQNTKLGWLVCGAAPVSSGQVTRVKASTSIATETEHLGVNLFCASGDLDVNKIIPKFWQLEEVTNKQFLSVDDKLCEQRFLESYKRLDNGAFQVNLPLRQKKDYLKLGNSFESATKEEILKYPLACKAILQQCYMDDILCGANSIQEALKLKEQLITLLKSAGFTLHKWGSNNKSLLESDNCSKQKKEFNISDDNYSNKVLGIGWQPLVDTFRITLPTSDQIGKYTKRQVLSSIAQIFDPLGFVGPVVVVAKILMQEIWAKRLDWDELLPEDIALKWQEFANSLFYLNKLNIPRWIFTSELITEIQIHGFSDSSMVAYGACVYVRALYADKTVTCHLLCSKSRIAPLKTISLPRLELERHSSSFA
ncbi:hypothetical protein NQ317_010249 [Molorchus minor]|uniref:Peptidase aspartic putative domain-containing protein n=1 Tax=Molorchus minor TaxID=1323400 RepID=A0ABQ9JHE5_9CUCU|nr:hypothetical protein NQ317_010249 [Molorchus minor]